MGVWTCPKDVKYVKFNSLDRQGGSLHTDFKHVKGTNCNVKFSIGSEEVIMRIRTSKIIEKTEEGAMFKRVMLRLFVKDATKDPVKVCKNVQKYDKGTVTWQSKPTVGKNPMDCVTFKPNKRFTWVSIDITDWVREWASNPKSNLGMTFIASSDDTFSFSTGLYPDPRERPILSLSCHGDRDDIGEQPEMKRNYVREMNRIANDMKKKHKKNPYGSKRKGGNETVVEKQEDALDDINDNIENDQTVLQLGNYSMSASNVQLDKKSGWSSQGYEEEKAKKIAAEEKAKKIAEELEKREEARQKEEDRKEQQQKKEKVAKRVKEEGDKSIAEAKEKAKEKAKKAKAESDKKKIQEEETKKEEQAKKKKERAETVAKELEEQEKKDIKVKEESNKTRLRLEEDAKAKKAEEQKKEAEKKKKEQEEKGKEEEGTKAENKKKEEEQGKEEEGTKAENKKKEEDKGKEEVVSS